MPNGRLFQLEIVAGKKRVPICLEVFEFEAVILPCTGVGWREDVLRFIRHKPVNNFVKKNLTLILPSTVKDCQPRLCNISETLALRLKLFETNRAALR